MNFFWENPTLQLNAEWSGAYVRALPNSAFLVVYKGERHLPVKNHLGKYDCDHIRSAMGRALQTTSIPLHLRKKAQARAKVLFKKHCGG